MVIVTVCHPGWPLVAAVLRLCHTSSVSKKPCVKCLKLYVVQQTYFKWILGALLIFECFTSKSNRYLELIYIHRCSLLTALSQLSIPSNKKKGQIHICSAFSCFRDMNCSHSMEILIHHLYRILISAKYSLKPRYSTTEKK